MTGIITLLDQPRTLDALARPTSATIYFYLSGTTTLANIYSDYLLATPATNPVTLSSGQLFPTIFLDPSIEYRRRIVYGDGTIHDVDPLNTVETAQVLNAKDFGAKGDGTTNDTTAMLAFFNACINGETRGHIPAGNYLINVGSLLFDNNNVRKAWPVITTDGAESVTFTGSGTGNLPIIEFRNGTYAGGSPSDNYWVGGYLGGITFRFATATAGTNRHGIKAYGMFGTRFGQMIGYSMGGSTVHLTNQKYLVTNPDPYAMTYCVWESVEGYQNKVRTFDNQNYVGMNFCVVENIRGIENESGVLFGLGGANVFNNISSGSCKGISVDSGNTADGTFDICTIGACELDNPEYAVRLATGSQVSAEEIRVIHRYNFGPLNPSGGYWPVVALSIGSATAPVFNSKLNVVHRLEVGGTKVQLGKFIDFNNAPGTIVNCSIEQRINVGSTGFSFTPAENYVNHNVNNEVLVTSTGRPILNTILNNSFQATTTALPILNSGYGTSTTILPYNSQAVDSGGVFDPVTYAFTAPYTGRAKFYASFALSCAADTRVRIALWRVRSGVGSFAAERRYYQPTAAVAQSYDISQEIDVLVGDQIFVMADQSTGTASINADPLSGFSLSTVFQGGMI